MDKKIIFLIFFIVVIMVVIVISIIMNDREKSTIENSLNINVTEEDNDSSITNKKNNINNSIEREEGMKLYLKVNNEILTVKLENNSSVDELLEKLKEQDITINMQDYANFEKVGSLGFNLTRNDRQITTEAGDIILYQGNQFVIYYDTNSWNFTKIGHIDNINQEDLKQILGKGNVTVVLSLERN